MESSTPYLRTQFIKNFVLILIYCLSISTLFSQQGFGNQIWNVNVYNSSGANANLATLPSNYVGYYTQKLDVSGNYGVNTTYSWIGTAGTNLSASNASAFNNSTGEGTAYVNVNGVVTSQAYTFIHKRIGFPAGQYKIVVDFWDDETYIFINGVLKTFYNFEAWGTVPETLRECIYLDENSTIEVRTASIENPSNLGLSITSTSFTADAGLSASICIGENEILNGASNNSNASFSWSGPSIINNPTALNPTVEPSVDANYILTAIFSECQITSTVFVDVSDPIGDPTLFGNHVWNVYGYNGANTNLVQNTYRGYYEQPTLANSNFGVKTQKFLVKL